MPSILYRVKPQTGLHISVIGMALYRMLKKAGLPFGMAALAAAGVM